MNGTDSDATARNMSGRICARGPSHRRAPVVADNDRLLLAEGMHQGDDVAGQMQDRIGGDVLRCIARAIAALIGCDDPESGIGERRNLVAPRVPGLGESVAQHDQRPVAGLGNVQFDVVDFDRAGG